MSARIPTTTHPPNEFFFAHQLPESAPSSHFTLMKRSLRSEFHLTWCQLCSKRSHLEILCKCRLPPHIEVVSLVGRGRLGEGPELILVELGAQQGGHHGQGSSEGPVSLGVDEQLVSQSCSVTRPCHHNSQETAQIRHHLRDLHKDSPLLRPRKTSPQGTKSLKNCLYALLETDPGDPEVVVVVPTYNVDVVHVSCRDFLSNLRYQVQSELDIIRLAGFRVYIPFRENKLGLMKGKAQTYHRLR